MVHQLLAVLRPSDAPALHLAHSTLAVCCFFFSTVQCLEGGRGREHKRSRSSERGRARARGRVGEAARERVRVSVQRARALIGSYNPLNRLLREVFHVLLQLPCVAGAILTNVHRDPQRDMVWRQIADTNKLVWRREPLAKPVCWRKCFGMKITVSP